jgi:hypothetical protein
MESFGRGTKMLGRRYNVWVDLLNVCVYFILLCIYHSRLGLGSDFLIGEPIGIVGRPAASGDWR